MPILKKRESHYQETVYFIEIIYKFCKGRIGAKNSDDGGSVKTVALIVRGCLFGMRSLRSRVSSLHFISRKIEIRMKGQSVGKGA